MSAGESQTCPIFSLESSSGSHRIGPPHNNTHHNTSAATAQHLVFDEISPAGWRSPNNTTDTIHEAKIAFTPLFSLPDFLSETNFDESSESNEYALWVIVSFVGGHSQRHRHGAAWNALLYGEKVWQLWPPHGGAAWTLTQRAGDVLVLPAGWDHEVSTRVDSFSIARRYIANKLYFFANKSFFGVNKL